MTDDSDGVFDAPSGIHDTLDWIIYSKEEGVGHVMASACAYMACTGDPVGWTVMDHDTLDLYWSMHGDTERMLCIVGVFVHPASNQLSLGDSQRACSNPLFGTIMLLLKQPSNSK